MRYYSLLAKDQNSNFLLNQYVQNLTIRASWRHVQPTASTFNWKAIDNALAALPTGGVAALSIHPGNDTPGWAMSQCANFTMADGTCFPAPWDNNFLAALNNLVQAVAAKYNGDSRIIRICIPALCAMTVETTLDNINTRFGTPSLSCAEAEIMSYWQSVGYTPQNAVYAVQQNVMSMQKALNAAACISFQPSNQGLDFDPVGGADAIKSIQSWYSVQSNVVVYNCGASAHWVYPQKWFPFNAYIYQTAGAMGTQKLFNQMMNLIYGQGVNDLEVYPQDLNFVPNAPTSATGYVEEEYNEEFEAED